MAIKLDEARIRLLYPAQISGNVQINGGTISYKTTNYTSNPILVYDDGTNHGHTLLVGAGGTTYVGAGEAAGTLYSKLGTKSSEYLILGADSGIWFYPGADSATSTSGVTLDSNKYFYPQTTNTGSIGTGSYKWASMYATTFYGNLTGTASRATADASGNTITSYYCTLSTAQTISGAKTFSGAIAANNRLTINTSLQDHSNPTSQCLVLNSGGLTDTVTEVTDKNSPGIGFHIGNVSWGSLIFNSAGFKFINNSATGYMNVTANKFIGALQGNVTGNVTGNVSGSSGSCTGNAATATALTSNAGSSTLPIYFSGGKPVAVTSNLWVYDKANCGGTMNDAAAFRNAMGMINLSAPSSGTASYVNPNAQTSWHHFINISYNTESSNMWQTQIANKAGTTDLWVRSRAGGSVSNSTAWAAPWTRIVTGSNFTSVLDGTYVNVSGDTMTGYLTVSTNSRYIQFGCQNTSYAHYSTNADNGHWFNKTVYVAGDIYAGSSYNQKVLHAGNYSSYALPLSGGTMTGALNLKNSTWNLAGDDAYFGDNDTAGSFAIKGKNGTTNLKMVTYNGTTYGTISWDGSRFVSSHPLTLNATGTWATTVNYANSLINLGTRMNAASSGTLYYLPWFGGYDGVTSTGYYNTVTMGLYHGVPSNAGFFIGMSWDGNNADTFYYFNRNGSFTANKVYGAVWNDYAEYRWVLNNPDTDEPIESGRCVAENGNDSMSLTHDRLQAGARIISDTYGMCMGETEKAKTPIAVCGRVLAYPFERKVAFNVGDPVCSGPNGTVSKMSREEAMMYPERIIGTVVSKPTYKEWGPNKIPVKGRIWIQVR